ncbi:MAG TPA: efflux RND transporter periplasmic adaptor subunit [Oculatellaceae cyanobacterium]
MKMTLHPTCMLILGLLYLYFATAVPTSAEQPENADKDPFVAVEIAPDVQKAIGIKTEPVTSLVPVNRKTANGQIEAIPADTAAVNAPLAGRVLTLLAQKGERVNKNQALAIIDSPEIRQLAIESQRLVAQNKAAETQAQAKVDLAMRNHEREKTLFTLKISSQKDYQTAEADLKQTEAELQTAKAQTKLSGALLASRLAQLGQSIEGNADGRVTLYAPISGIVLDQFVTPGEALEPGKPLFKLIDIRNVWATAQIYEKDLQHARVGQQIEIRTPAYPGRTFKGTILNIDPVVDPATRTLAIRAAIANPGSLLKPQMFATIDLVEASSESSYFVPTESVVSIQGRQSVFIKEGEKFIPTPVETGDTQDNLIEIKSGLQPGQRVVTQRAYQLMAQGAKAAIPSEEEEKEGKSKEANAAQPYSILLLTLGGFFLLIIGVFAGQGLKRASAQDRTSKESLFFSQQNQDAEAENH